MKLYSVVLGLTLIGASTAASFATDSNTPPSGGTPATQTTPATTPPADTQTPATPATPPTGEQTPAAATQPDPNEKICKRDDTTGSRLGKVCKTRKEWEEQGKNNGGGDF